MLTKSRQRRTEEDTKWKTKSKKLRLKIYSIQYLNMNHRKWNVITAIWNIKMKVGR